MHKRILLFSILALSLTGCVSSFLTLSAGSLMFFGVRQETTVSQTSERAIQAPELAPPAAFVEIGDGERDAMRLGSYCWAEGNAEVCSNQVAENIPTTFTMLPDDIIRLQFDIPMPTRVTVRLYSPRSVGSDPVAEAVLTQMITRWEPAAPAGDYLLEVNAEWTDDADGAYGTGEGQYFLDVTLPE